MDLEHRFDATHFLLTFLVGRQGQRKEELSHKGLIHLSISWTLKFGLIEEAFSWINLVAKGLLGLFSRQDLA